MIDRAYWHRQAELGGFKSVELAAMLRERGWRCGGRDRKQDRVMALMHLEGFKVDEGILAGLKLEPVGDCVGAQTS